MSPLRTAQSPTKAAKPLLHSPAFTSTPADNVLTTFGNGSPQNRMPHLSLLRRTFPALHNSPWSLRGIWNAKLYLEACTSLGDHTLTQLQILAIPPLPLHHPLHLGTYTRALRLCLPHLLVLHRLPRPRHRSRLASPTDPRQQACAFV